MARKKTNSQKARERRELESHDQQPSESASTGGASVTQELEPAKNTLESRKKWTVLAILVVGLLFFAGLLAAERWLGDDDDATPTSVAGSVVSPVADIGIVRDPELSARCWPNGGPVPGMESDAASPPSIGLDAGVTYTATITTSHGSFQVEFFPDEAPNTVNSFICLANEGYYDDTLFHRIIAGFMFQGGDPLGTGTGGPGYRYDDEPIVRDYTTGTLAMANAGPNTNGSQFFVILDNLTDLGRLPKNYTIFGQVVSGMEAVEAIAAVEVGPNPMNPNEMSAPLEPVRLISIEITTSPQE